MAFSELIGRGYVEFLTKGEDKLHKGLNAVEKKMQSVERTGRGMGGTIGKMFMMGLGIGSAEQIVSRVTNAVGQLVAKMKEAEERGEAVGNGIARWAAELTKLDNAVTVLDRIMAREAAGRATSAKLEDFLKQRLGIKQPQGREVLEQIDKDIADTKKAQADLRRPTFTGGVKQAIFGTSALPSPKETKSLELQLEQLTMKRRRAEQDIADANMLAERMTKEQQFKPRFTSLEEFGRKVNLAFSEPTEEDITRGEEEQIKLLREIADRLRVRSPL